MHFSPSNRFKIKKKKRVFRILTKLSNKGIVPIFVSPNNRPILFARVFQIRRYEKIYHRASSTLVFLTLLASHRDRTLDDLSTKRLRPSTRTASLSRWFRKGIEEERKREFDRETRSRRGVGSGKDTEIVIGLEEERARRGSEATRRGRRERKEGEGWSSSASLADPGDVTKYNTN